MTTPIFQSEKSIEGHDYVISNKIEWLSSEFIQHSLARKEIYWTGSTPTPLKAIETMIANSCTLGLYKSKSSDASQEAERIQIGFARLITDYVTIAYLTDVFILPENQGSGLGQWLISCSREIIDSMPDLRRALLMTAADGKGVKFYERELDMKVVQTGDEGRVVMMYVPTSS
jgi:GNAT superfamily N-acetyltransferase